MARGAYGYVGVLLFILFLIIGGLISILFPEPFKTYIFFTSIILGLILTIFIIVFLEPILTHSKEKRFKGEEKYIICPDCNIQVEKKSGICPKCGKNLLYSSKIEAE